MALLIINYSEPINIISKAAPNTSRNMVRTVLNIHLIKLNCKKYKKSQFQYLKEFIPL
jgi:hypothetical protein